MHSTHAGTATDFVPLASLEGHDAFLVDIEPFAAAIGHFLGSNKAASRAVESSPLRHV